MRTSARIITCFDRLLCPGSYSLRHGAARRATSLKEGGNESPGGSWDTSESGSLFEGAVSGKAAD